MAEEALPWNVFFVTYPVFEVVGYVEIQQDTARYVRIQLDIVGYSGIQWICCKMARYRSIDTGIHGIPRIQ